MPRSHGGRTAGATRSADTGVQSQLLLLLLAFGAIPVGMAMTVGYLTSRATLLREKEVALLEYSTLQIGHFRTEFFRQRSLLTSIGTQLGSRFADAPAREVARVLERSLMNEGVFDALRLVEEDGAVVARAAVDGFTPLWPDSAPASDWTGERVMNHRSGDGMVAYLLAVPVLYGRRLRWLEGYVRAEAFTRLFDLTVHPLGGVEQGIFTATELPVVVPHPHSTHELRLAVASVEPSRVTRTEIAGTRGIVLALPIPGTDWTLVAFLSYRRALAPMATLARTAILSFLGLLVLIVVVAHMVARFVTTPLRDLALAALEFGSEGSYRPVSPGRVRETITLVDSFDRMASDLARSREEIDLLHEREMERAQQLASVGELASGVAHEIRNPLTGVMGALEMAFEKVPVDDPASTLIEESRNQLRRIEAATTQLLRYARPPTLRRVVVDVDLLVKRAMAVVLPMAESERISVEAVGAKNAVSVNVDPELLVQVFVNLILNGIEAAGAGGTVRVRVAKQDGRARIWVSDTGPGVADELRPEIFRPFFTSKHQGTGLGLSISQQIVKRHDGDLTLEHAAPGGATFLVVLPLAEPACVDD